MADFLKAFNNSIGHEGGWVNDPADKGGETYNGIARNFHPNWEGWQLLDAIPNKKRFDIFPQLNSLVANFYYSVYWLRLNLNKIINDDLAALVFDWTLNSGGAAREIQKILNSQFGFSLVIDGIIGKNTINALNAVNAAYLINQITQARVNYYKSGVSDGWLDKKFLNGLIARAESFYTETVQTVGKPPQQV